MTSRSSCSEHGSGPFFDVVVPSTREATPHRTTPGADVAILLGRFGTGGVERVACLLQNGFAERGLQTEVLVANRSGPLADQVGKEIRVIELARSIRFAGRSLSLILSIPWLVRHIRRCPPRILLSPGNHTNLVAAVAHRLAGGETRLVLKITNPILNERHGAIRRWLRRHCYDWAFGRAAQVLVLSRFAEREIARRWPAAAGRVRFVHNPYVEPLAAREADPPLPLVRTRDPLILSVGRLTAQKNHTMLFRALARLDHLPWRLVLLGEGPLKDRLRALAEELHIASRVEIAGFVPDPNPFYREAHVLALSSDWEDLPAVVLEALAAGVPVVTTACSGGLIEVMREAGHGRLTEPGNVRAFADALEQLLTQSFCRKPFLGAQNYSLESGIKDHLAAIRPLLEQAQEPRRSRRAADCAPEGTPIQPAGLGAPA
jgi:glycosyltransferase involved in cell wall biosynthesis